MNQQAANTLDTAILQSGAKMTRLDIQHLNRPPKDLARVMRKC